MSRLMQPRQPWYRHPWPWILMAGPAVVVVAGIITAWIAVSTHDGLVADDYYKQGLAVNQKLARNDTAARMQLEARLRLSAGRRRTPTEGPVVRAARRRRQGRRATRSTARPARCRDEPDPLRAAHGPTEQSGALTDPPPVPASTTSL